MPFVGFAGEIVEVRRSERDLWVDWRILGFLDLPCEGDDHYDSPPFDFYDAVWHLRVWPNYYSSGDVLISIRGDDDDAGPSARTVDFAAGVRVSVLRVECWGAMGGVFRTKDCHPLLCMYTRSELRGRKDRIPGDALTVACQMKVPRTAAKDALDGDADEKHNGNTDRENDDESKKKKDLNLLSRVKNTKKISLPARHGDVIRSLKAILAEGRRADFSLKSGGGEWRVHRAILEGRSGHFEALFRGEWAERDEVRLDDVPEGALDGVLHFAYAGEVGDMSAESVCGIYGAAHRFLLEDLKSLCVEYMEERMGPEMVCGALAVAETHGEGDLKERAMECFFRESGTICETEGWKELKANHPAIIAELFKEFIKRERKNRKKERD